MSEESAILFEDISSSRADTKSVVRAAVSLSPFDVPEEKGDGERGEVSPVGRPEGLIELGIVCETEVGTETDVEDKDVDVVGGVDEVGVSGYGSKGFTLSESYRRKRLAKKKVSEGVADTAHFSQCGFSNVQHLPLTFLLEFNYWTVIEFY